MKKVLTISIISIFASLFFVNSFAETKKKADDGSTISAEMFLKNLRGSHPVDTWADMTGDIEQKKRLKNDEYKTTQGKIKVGILFTKNLATAIIKISETDLNSEDTESYKVGQPYTDDSSAVLPSSLNSSPLISEYGITPGDFTMSFLWWSLNSENQNQITSVKGLECRIINLENKKTKEKVRVFASLEYYYPLKVEWFKSKSKNPYRTMVIESFALDNNLGAPKSISLSGTGWKTKIKFENVKLGFSSKGVPEDLFK